MGGKHRAIAMDDRAIAIGAMGKFWRLVAERMLQVGKNLGFGVWGIGTDKGEGGQGDKIESTMLDHLA
jgi:hypothetical protein